MHRIFLSTTTRMKMLLDKNCKIYGSRELSRMPVSDIATMAEQSHSHVTRFCRDNNVTIV